MKDRNEAELPTANQSKTLMLLPNLPQLINDKALPKRIACLKLNIDPTWIASSVDKLLPILAIP
jgi:hypothetical protein